MVETENNNGQTIRSIYYCVDCVTAVGYLIRINDNHTAKSFNCSGGDGRNNIIQKHG